MADKNNSQPIPLEMLLSGIGKQVKVDIEARRRQLLDEIGKRRQRLDELRRRRQEVTDLELTGAAPEPVPATLPTAPVGLLRQASELADDGDDWLGDGSESWPADFNNEPDAAEAEYGVDPLAGLDPGSGWQGDLPADAGLEDIELDWPDPPAAGLGFNDYELPEIGLETGAAAAADPLTDIDLDLTDLEFPPVEAEMRSEPPDPAAAGSLPAPPGGGDDLADILQDVAKLDPDLADDWKF